MKEEGNRKFAIAIIAGLGAVASIISIHEASAIAQPHNNNHAGIVCNNFGSDRHLSVGAGHQAPFC